MLAGRARREDERHRTDRARRVRRRAQRATELFEHDRGVDHAHARPAELLGHEQTDDPHVAQAVPHRVAAERVAVGVVLLAHVADRCLVGQETPHGVAQHLLIGTELEVHDAPARVG